MPNLPSGTVTLLFTDIEGSTRLLDELRGDYEELLERHHAILRQAIAANDGVEVSTEGDAFFCAFPRAPAAIAMAAQSQRALVEQSWPQGRRVRVRMGMHTGTPTLAGDNYLGIDVHRAARIAAAGHGGQVLVSETTRELVRDTLPEGLGLRDLGEHRLKDLSQPQRLYQLLVEAMEADFPALKTLENRPTNLPVQPTALVGRERELAESAALLRREDVRLLTLTGPGGTGKTRLALQLGAELLDDYPDGVYFVALAPIVEPELVLPTVAAALAVRAAAGASVEQALAEELAGKQLLLILDNLEQVVEAAPSLARLLLQAPGLKLVATSRIPLHLSGEQEYPVPTLAEEEGVVLFLARAQAVKPGFLLNGEREQVAEICRRLDGLPLAIELAAARIRMLSPQALLGRLDERLKLLTGGARDLPERQQTLRAAIDWSYSLLSEQEQTLFARLSVFAGGCTLEAAEAVCAPEGELDVFEGLASLVDKSLLVQEEGAGGEPRFRMLETIREYAGERLAASGEREQVSFRHASFFRMLVDATRLEARVAGVRGDLLDRLECELDNVRGAIEWASAGQIELELALAGLPQMWDFRGHVQEGRSRLEAAIARGSKLEGEIVLTRAKLAAAHLAFVQLDLDDCRRLAESGLVDARGLNDPETIVAGLIQSSLVLTEQGDTATARGRLREALTIAERDERCRFFRLGILNNLASLEIGESRFESASAALRQVIDEARAADALEDLVLALLNLAIAEIHCGDGSGVLNVPEAFSLAEQIGWPEMFMYGFEIVAASSPSEYPHQAACLQGAAARMREDLGVELQSFEQGMHDRTETQLRETLGEEEYKRRFSAGQAMSREEAVAAALEAVQVANRSEPQ